MKGNPNVIYNSFHDNNNQLNAIILSTTLYRRHKTTTDTFRTFYKITNSPRNTKIHPKKPQPNKMILDNKLNR